MLHLMLKRRSNRKYVCLSIYIYICTYICVLFLFSTKKFILFYVSDFKHLEEKVLFKICIFHILQKEFMQTGSLKFLFSLYPHNQGLSIISNMSHKKFHLFNKKVTIDRCTQNFILYHFVLDSTYNGCHTIILLCLTYFTQYDTL